MAVSIEFRIIILICSISSACSNTVTPVEWETANRMCHQLRAEFGELLPTDQTLYQHESILSFMMEMKVTSLWLSYKRVVFEKPKWISGLAVDSGMIYGPRNKGHCGFLHARDKRLELGPCGTTDFGYICQISACTGCSGGRLDQECFLYNRTCFMVGCGAKHWHEAEQKCQSIGGRLASPISKRMRDILSHAIRSNKKSQKNFKYWVGFRDADWFTSTSTEEELAAKASRWAPGEPKKDENCSIAVLQEKKLVWKTSSCHIKHPFHCFKVEHTGGSPIEHPSQGPSVAGADLTWNPNPSGNATEPTATSTPIWTFVMIVLLALTLLVGLILCILYLKKCCKRKKDDRGIRFKAFVGV